MIKSCLLIVSLLSLLSVQPDFTNEESKNSITFEGVLLANSPYRDIACGGIWFHQLGKYRVEKVLKGVYKPKEMVVDHAACWGDVFQGIPVGCKVRLTVSVYEDYHTITTYPGIREIVDVENLSDAPRVFYVSLEPPRILRTSD